MALKQVPLFKRDYLTWSLDFMYTQIFLSDMAIKRFE